MSWLEEYIKKEKLKEEKHTVEPWIGYCKDCDRVESKGDVASLMKVIPSFRNYLRDSNPDYAYVCKQCGFPIARTAEEFKSIVSCPWCDSVKVWARKDWEAEKAKRMR